MGDNELGVLKGTLDLMILKALSWGPVHGYGVVQWIKRTSGGSLSVDDGALYPALHRLVRQGWIDAEWGRSENNRRAKFYRLTPVGRKRLTDAAEEWARFSAALDQIVAATDPAAS